MALTSSGRNAAPVGEQPEPELERLRRALAKATRERDLLFGSMPLGEAKAVLSGRERRDVVLDEPQPALAAVVLPIGVAMLLAAVDDERWWKRMEREHRENVKW